MNYRFNNPQPATSWRERLETIKTAKKELSDYYSIMTPYERATADREIGRLKEQHNKAITEGVLSEHEIAINRLNIAHKKVQRETQKEIAGWDAQKLASEMQVYSLLFDQAIKTIPGTGDFRKNLGDRLEKIYSEAWQSGDKYKQRAAAEIMQSIQNKAADLNAKMVLNRFEQQAKQDIEKVRSTPELEKAYQEAETDWQNYQTARQELITTARDIGEGDPLHALASGPFSMAIKRVQIINNEIKIYEPDDPEVTGIMPMVVHQEVPK